MANIEQKRVDFYRKWNGVYLSDMGGYVSEEYNKFQNAFKRILNYVAEELGATLVWYHKMHYDECAMFERNGKYVYLSRSSALMDYRSVPRFKGILIRTAAHSEDYRGGSNNYCNWANLTNEIDKLLGGKGEIEDINNFPIKQWWCE